MMLVSDLTRMFRSQSCCDVLLQTEGSPSSVPDPMCACVSPCKCKSTWMFYMLHPAWPRAVLMLFWVTSRHDHFANPDPAPPSECQQFGCTICQAAKSSCKHVFDTSKGLVSHCRAKHAKRCEMRRYVGESTTCIACERILGTRLSLIAHLSDSRRLKCRDIYLASVATISPELCIKLDIVDKEARKMAQRNGYSHAIVTVPARLAWSCEV